MKNEYSLSAVGNEVLEKKKPKAGKIYQVKISPANNVYSEDNITDTIFECLYLVMSDKCAVGTFISETGKENPTA